MIENASLKAYNTFGIQAIARWFASFSSQEELAELLEWRTRGNAAPTSAAPGNAAPPFKIQHSKFNIPLLVLGGGSNILFTRDVDGLVIKNGIKGIDLLSEDEHYVYVRAGAGENWHAFVQYCLQRNWAGLENLSLIPGNVGAAPMQNIGAYGVEIKEVFYELEAWSLDDNKVYMFSVNDCAFGYRESVFKSRYKGQFVILNVTFRLSKTPKFHVEYGAIREELDKMGIQQLSIQAVSKAVINIRSSKLPDPAQIGNAGSFFKNPTVSGEKFAALTAQFPGIIGYPNPAAAALNPSPLSGSATAARDIPPPLGGRGVGGQSVKLAAGWLIEQCGWKGYRKGDAGCHARQALVLVNYGQASGKEIYDLSEEILQSVQQKFGVTLEREVNIVPTLF